MECFVPALSRNQTGETVSSLIGLYKITTDKKDKILGAFHSVERLEKIFPDYFERFELPEGAREEKIKVYRACRSGKCDSASFLPSYEEAGFKLNPMADSREPGQYSLSNVS